MHRTILVVGSVSSKQYKLVRWEHVDKGHKPKIVRMTREELFLDTDGLLEHATAEERLKWSREMENSTLDPDLDDTLDAVVARHVESLGRVVAIVYDEAAWNWLILNPNRVNKALEGSEKHIERWVVRENFTEYAN